jgi:hypothetical protein
MPGQPRMVFLGFGKFARGRIYALEPLPSELADDARACGSTGSPTPSLPRGPSARSCTTWDRMPPRKRRSSTTHSTSPTAWSRRPTPVGPTPGTSGDGPADRSRPPQARTPATSRCLAQRIHLSPADREELAEVGVVVDPVPHKLHVPGQVALADQDVMSDQSCSSRPYGASTVVATGRASARAGTGSPATCQPRPRA